MSYYTAMHNEVASIKCIIYKVFPLMVINNVNLLEVPIAYFYQLYALIVLIIS